MIDSIGAASSIAERQFASTQCTECLHHFVYSDKVVLINVPFLVYFPDQNYIGICRNITFSIEDEYSVLR